jgi:hypothetical protein
MRLSKVEKLVNLLNSKELVEFKTALRREGKSRLLLLVGALKKKKKTLQDDSFKEGIYQKLFNEPYLLKKDYLLRKEFQLLAQGIENYLVEAYFREEMQDNKLAFHFYLLSAFQERRALDLFDGEYREAYDRSLQKADYYAAFAISGMNYSKYADQLHDKERNLEVAQNLNEIQVNHLGRFFLAAYRRYQVNWLYMMQLRFPFSAQISPEEYPAVQLEQFQSEQAAYLFEKAKNLLLPNEQRVKATIKNLAFAKERQKDSPFFQEEVKYCLSELVNLYKMLHDYRRVEKYYLEFLQLDQVPGDLHRLAVLIDYIGKLLAQHRLREAFVLIEKNEAEINQVDKYKVMLRCLKTAAYALDADAPKLFLELPKSFEDYNIAVTHFFRLMYAIQAWLAGEPVQAQREIENLLNTLQKKTAPLVFDVVPTSKFMLRYFRLQANATVSARDSGLVKLKGDVQEYKKHARSIYGSYLPLIWLLRELGE